MLGSANNRLFLISVLNLVIEVMFFNNLSGHKHIEDITYSHETGTPTVHYVFYIPSIL